MVKKVFRNNNELVKKRNKRLALFLGLFAFSLYVGFLLSNMK
jgi:uncharacterized membrane protein (DUF485 family)